MNNKFKVFILLSFSLFFSSCRNEEGNKNIEIKDTLKSVIKDSVKIPDIELLSGTFLGNNSRNYYGDEAPSELKLIWKHNLGGGHSRMPHGDALMYGAGWTGQPLLIKEKGKKFLFQGALDHNLKKIDAETGKLIWEYEFDDVIKATGTLWINNKAAKENEKLIVLQGSRQGYNFSMGSKYIWSFRGISGINGEELFRINVKRTESVSRDVDGSAAVVNDIAYIGFENGLLTVFNPNPKNTRDESGYNVPEIFDEIKLYEKSDVAKHRGNVINESSPCLLGNRLYIAAGSGHIYGYNLITKEIDWDFYIGSDLNGSCVSTSDSCLLVPVEKQYIAGNGGVLKLNPNKPEAEAVVWYFQTTNRTLSDWEGGVIGSPSANDRYVTGLGEHLAAFTGIDGYLYVVKHNEIENGVTERGFDGKKNYSKPVLVFKYTIGSSISSPIILKDKIVAAGYSGLYLFGYSGNEFKLIDKKSGCFEATPICDNKKIFIAGKDGFLYCYGND